MILLDGRLDKLLTLDLSDPAADTTEIGDLISGLNPTSVATHSSSLYVGSSKRRSLYIVDATDPDAEDDTYGEIGDLPAGTVPTSLASNGTNLFMLDGRQDRLYQLNTTTPASSTLVGSLIAGIQPVAMAFVGTSFYVAGTRDNGLYLIDATDPDAEDATYGRIGTLPGSPLALGVDSSTLYMIDNRDILYSLDTDDLADSTEIVSIPEGISPLDLD